AITNLPYFFINGNTPAGIYKLGKKTIAKNLSIGKTPILPIFLPVEISKKEFLNRTGEWREEDVKNLFPKSWWGHAEIYESFHAGKLGRSQIAIHGSRVEPHNFKEFEFFPFQPALGCLTTLELWTEENRLKYSYQVELLQILGEQLVEGFVYVVNRNFERRILLEDVLFDILEAEASLP
ncbi:MAG: hypothetical protein N3A69_11340, partial [Leptospiraceae bacterium]|nr:hypothetical protein [Leptospiraceae bacterium]